MRSFLVNGLFVAAFMSVTCLTYFAILAGNKFFIAAIIWFLVTSLGTFLTDCDW